MFAWLKRTLTLDIRRWIQMDFISSLCMCEFSVTFWNEKEKEMKLISILFRSTWIENNAIYVWMQRLKWVKHRFHIIRKLRYYQYQNIFFQLSRNIFFHKWLCKKPLRLACFYWILFIFQLSSMLWEFNHSLLIFCIYWNRFRLKS